MLFRQAVRFGLMVLPDHVNDSDMVLLARDISKQIEAELEILDRSKSV